VWPPTFNANYGEVVLRGCAKMVPAMAQYRGQASRGLVDGGYYCKTPENRPLIGPLPVEGRLRARRPVGHGRDVVAWNRGAACPSRHRKAVPHYAKWFVPSRYDDPVYRALVDRVGPLVGQL